MTMARRDEGERSKRWWGARARQDAARFAAGLLSARQPANDLRESPSPNQQPPDHQKTDNQSPDDWSSRDQPPEINRLTGAVPTRTTDTAAAIAAFTAAFDVAPVGMAVLDAQGRYLHVNEALARIDGLPAEAHLGQRPEELFGSLNPSAADLRRVIETGEPIVDLYFASRAVPHAEQEPVWSVNYRRLTDASGRVLGLGCTVVDVTESSRGMAEMRAVRGRLALLNEASARVGTTLDVETTARELAEVAVPAFADIVFVDVVDQYLDPSGDQCREPATQPLTLRRLAVGAARYHAEWQRDLSETPCRDCPPASGVHRVLRTGTSRFIAEIGSGEFEFGAHTDVQVERLRRAGAHSVIVAPLRARGSVLGVAVFVRTSGTHRFAAGDVEVAEELAARAALCVDNARLYAREHAVALSLQRSLLPQQVLEGSGVEVAYRYLPAGDAAEVGGDWFDVIQLAGNRVALVVGDVMGSGVRAAGIMGQFRTAVRTLAGLDLSPAHVLRQLDDLFASMSESHLATCVYAVYDPTDRTCAMASAGHLPPLLVDPGGTVRRVELTGGAPLGVGNITYETYEFSVHDGSRLVLYTDGMVEKRGEDIDDGVDALAALLAAGGPELDELCESLIAPRTGSHRDDDATVLVASLRELPSQDVASWVLTSTPAVASRARELVRGQLARWDLERLVDTTELLVSELVTNALRHARGPIELRLMRADGLVCEVADALEAAPQMRRARSTDEGGRGLHLVNQLAGRWGTRGTASGKIVWFELSYPTIEIARL
jgi:PAS domain S-box-containing protein